MRPTEENTRRQGTRRTVAQVDDENPKNAQPKYMRSKQGETQPGLIESHSSAARTPALFSEGHIFISR